MTKFSKLQTQVYMHLCRPLFPDTKSREKLECWASWSCVCSTSLVIYEAGSENKAPPEQGTWKYSQQANLECQGNNQRSNFPWNNDSQRGNTWWEWPALWRPKRMFSCCSLTGSQQKGILKDIGTTFLGAIDLPPEPAPWYCNLHPQ